MPDRRIGHLDTPEKCTRECELVYRLAWKGKIAWPEAQGAAAVLERMWKMVGGRAVDGAANGEAKWEDVGKNAVRG
jgi:hypothetical protein